jgi:hypothetical protein
MPAKDICYRGMALGMLVLPLLLLGCAQHGQKGAVLSPCDHVALTDTVTTNTLKVVKTPGGKVETLHLEEAIVENKGTEKEKKCLCQAICFRVAQLAAQAWDDGVFRTYEVERIRTGWNTPGPYEFFSDKELNGEIGDLEIPAERIVVQKRDGGEAASFKELTLQDNWYEFTLTNGRVLFLRVKDGDSGVFPAGFLALRNRLKSGDEDAKKLFKPHYEQVLARIATVPFDRITVRKAGPTK